jgi:hypothetical protein
MLKNHTASFLTVHCKYQWIVPRCSHDPRTGRTLIVTIAIAVELALGTWSILPQLLDGIARHRLEAGV